MKARWLIRSILIVLLLALATAPAAFTASCEPVKAQADKIRVVVTILPQVEFVKAVGGDRVEVTVMVPPGADPHVYEPSPSQLQAVSEAEIYVKVGSGVEFEIAHMATIESYLPSDAVIVDCSQGVMLMGADPHIWNSPLNAKIMVENICHGLIAADPANQAYYEDNRDAYLKRLDELDGNISDMLSGVADSYFMTYHPAWGYFARDYGLTQIQVEQEGKEPTAREIAASVEMAKEHNIKVIFVALQFPTESAQVIAREIGGQVVYIDPLPEDYITEMYIFAAYLARPGEAEATAPSQWWYWAVASGVGGVALGAIGMYVLAGRRAR
jgi:zinc transport system substrate-binding protein